MPQTPIDKDVTVVGAGLMGSGIDHAFVSAGHAVTPVDVRSEALEKVPGSSLAGRR